MWCSSPSSSVRWWESFSGFIRRARPRGSIRLKRCATSKRGALFLESNVLRWMKATSELPDDPALPALAAIRRRGLAQSIPALGLDDGPVHFELLRYHSGRRAVIEVRAGQRRFAVKICAADPFHEAAIHEALASAGLANGSGARVPPLLAWDQKLRVLVIGWFDGPSAAQLIEHGQGARAGE